MADNEHLIDVVKDIRYLVDKYNKKVKATKISKSVSQQLFIDFAMLYSLLDIFHINDADLQMVRPYSYFDHFLPAKAKRDIEQLREVSEPAIQAYKDAGFCFADRLSTKYIKAPLGEEIIYDFLGAYFPDSVDLLEKLFKNDSLLMNPLVVHQLDAAGISYMVPSLDEYRMFIEDGDLTTITSIATFLHEFMHIYVTKTLYDYDWRSYLNYRDGYYLEAPTYFTEYLLYDFMRRYGLYEEALNNANVTDYNHLYALKEMVYLAEMVRRKYPVNFKTDPIVIDGKYTDFEVDRGMPFFEYERGKNSCENVSLENSIGVLESFQMLEQVKNGAEPSEVLYELLKKLKYNPGIRDIIKPTYNYGFIAKEVGDRVKALRTYREKGRK